MARAKKEDLNTAREPETEENAREEENRDPLTELPNPCVYCGPSIRGVTRQYTIYQGGGLPAPLKEVVNRHPEAAKLIVSVGKFKAMRRRLDTPGTQEAKLYKALKEALARGRSV